VFKRKKKKDRFVMNDGIFHFSVNYPFKKKITCDIAMQNIVVKLN